jgi:cytosine/adenosine deaminase-related metal-dependent hydrolase
VDDIVAEVGTGLPLGDSEPVDLSGWLLLRAAVEPHAHLDKAFLAERIENPTGDLMGAITAMEANRSLLHVGETIERAERAARLMAATDSAPCGPMRTRPPSTASRASRRSPRCVAASPT